MKTITDHCFIWLSVVSGCLREVPHLLWDMLSLLWDLCWRNILMYMMLWTWKSQNPMKEKLVGDHYLIYWRYPWRNTGASSPSDDPHLMSSHSFRPSLWNLNRKHLYSICDLCLLIHISQVRWEACLVPPEMKKGQEFSFYGEIKKASSTAVKWAEGKHIKRKACGRNWRGEGVETCWDGETFSSHWQIFRRLHLCT